MGLVHDRENASPTSNEWMSRDLVDLKAFRWWRDVVEGDVEGRGLGGEGVEHVFSEVAVESDEVLCTARRCVVAGRWAAGLDPRVGRRRWGDGGLEAAVAGGRWPNP